MNDFHKQYGDIASLTEKRDITDKITIIATSDNVVLDSYKVYKCGNIIDMIISYHPASQITFSGDTATTFKFSMDKYIPIVGANSAAYTWNYAGIGAIDSNGIITIRIVEQSGYITENAAMDIRFFYITS